MTAQLTRTITSAFRFFRNALKGEEMDFTQGSIHKAVFMLAIPMILEMMMESVFAVVDIFFVGRLGNEAVAAVALTESVLTLVYSVAIGLSMAATALVARRVGEKNFEEASKSGMQAILLALFLTTIISILGAYYAEEILRLMGAGDKLVNEGAVYTRIIFCGSIVVMLLFLINGIFRGAGNAALAMQSLWIANIFNIILCPVLINGWGPFPELGLKGAAIATTAGRGIGVAYQLTRLVQNKGSLRFKWSYFKPYWNIIKSLFNIAWTGTTQFLIGSASWIVLARIVAEFHEDALAGYQVAIRVLMFFLLPAWGLSNAAATLTGQNLGAKKEARAEQSVWVVVRYNAIFMLCVSLFFLLFAEPLIDFMNTNASAQQYAIQAIHIVSLGYVFYGVGMVMMNAFNGAGDTKTPTLINLFGFWMFQIPVAYLLALHLNYGPKGVFIAIVSSETLITIVSLLIFKRGKWKLVKV